MNTKKGQLTCVGIGMTLGAHISPVCRQYIADADICFVAVSSGIVERWVEKLNSNCVSLQPLYQEGKPRTQTYAQMTEIIIAALTSNKRVCGVFYGHPGVFAFVPHKVIEIARNQGFLAHMEPGISAEDCLYADLGIDPGKFGCQHYEATQFMLYKRQIDPSAYLILWQIGVAGDVSLSSAKSNKKRLQVLIELLFKIYPTNHKAIVYEAKTLSISNFRAESVEIANLSKIDLHEHSTLVIPPSISLIDNKEIRKSLKELQ